MASQLVGFGAAYPNGNDQYTKILLNFNEINGSTAFIDEAAGKTSAHTWTAGGTATNSTAQAKFGAASLACGAGVDWIESADHADFTLGSGDFTFDAWVYRSGGDGGRRFIASQCDNAGSAASQSFALELDNTNVFRGSMSDGVAKTLITGTTTFTATGWNHVALVRTGNIANLFVNGTKEGGDVAFSATMPNSTNKFAIGRAGEASVNQWNGFIDAARLSVGIARWTANFTVPSIPYF